MGDCEQSTDSRDGHFVNKTVPSISEMQAHDEYGLV